MNREYLELDTDSLVSRQSVELVPIESGVDDVLKFTVDEVVNRTTFIHQVDNGTIFFRDAETLWVKHDGAKIETQLLGGFRYSIMAVFGDSVYYGSNWKKKIYRAIFNPPGEIAKYYVRDLIKDENIHEGGICSIIVEEKLYVYKMCDDPIRDRIQVDVPLDTLEWAELKGLHGNTAIFRYVTVESVLPSVKRLGRNAILLSCYRGKPRRFFEFLNLQNEMDEFYAPWGSPAVSCGAYVYLSNGSSLFVVDPYQVKVLPQLYFQDVSSFHIAGIHDGRLVGRGKCTKTGKYRLMMADLPQEYMMEARHSAEQSTMAVDEVNLGNTRYSSPSVSYSSKFLTDFSVKSIRGEGAFGCVFEVINKYDDHAYAVKRVAVADGYVDSALNEVRAMAKLSHANIIGYNSTWVETPPRGWQAEADQELLKKLGSSKRRIGRSNDYCAFIYIQMQLARFSLSEWLTAHQNPSDRDIYRMKSWFKQIVCAVEYIHCNNLIHRDLKPSNVLIVEENRLKLCDLGIARERKFDDDDSYITGTWGGTTLYMSPEQMFRYSSKSDVFTLGLILAELCLVMTDTDRYQIFDNYRHGVQCESIEDEKTAEFISWLTQVHPKNRPTCSEMLDHEFLA